MVDPVRKVRDFNCEYTGSNKICDKVKLHQSIFVLNIFPLHILILCRNGRDYLHYLRGRALPGLSGGACGLASYGIAIWAMTQAPIALVAALRETSVIFGMLLAIVFLGERFSPLRALAVVLVACGGMVLRLA